MKPTSTTSSSSDLLFDPAQLPVFEVDSIMGFMAPHQPPSRLPDEWEIWEATLDEAVRKRIRLGDKIGLSEDDKRTSQQWREDVKQLDVLSIDNLKHSKPLLRRAHLVLSYIQHFYLQSLPPDQPTILPRSISLPLLRLSAVLRIPPILTYSDTVLYNWRIEGQPSTATPAASSTTTTTTQTKPDLKHLRSQTTFTNTTDEEEFYLCSARIEVRGVEALDVMRIIMDEMFLGDEIAVWRITGHLAKLASVICELKTLLEDVKKRCDPDRYFNDVRPWFRGEDADSVVRYAASDPQSGERPRRNWVFEGIEEDPELEEPAELSGPSAGQSSIVHVLDVFLGVDHESHSSSSSSPNGGPPSFITRMKTYMPYYHRLFIDHLASYPRPLRSFVLEHENEELRKAYNQAVRALKVFRDAHMIIAALYILGPARRAREKAKAVSEVGALEANDARVDGKRKKPLKGTGGTDLVNFLKDTRTRTMNTVIPE